MDQRRIEEIEGLVSRATRGPWRLHRAGAPAEVIDPEGLSLGRIWTRPDAELIVQAPAVLTELLAEVRRARSEGSA
jgi:hypothetical protein